MTELNDVNGRETKQSMDDIENNNNRKSQFQRRLYDEFRRKSWIFPLLIAVSLPLFCLTFYSFAAIRGHLKTILQYVSDSGTYPPSAGSFSAALDLMGIFVFITAHARYKQIGYYLRVTIHDDAARSKSSINDCENGATKCETKNVTNELIKRLQKINFGALLLAYVSSIGSMAVGNYRSDEALLWHGIGAFLMFLALFAYGACMIEIGGRLAPYGIESRPITLTVGLAVQIAGLFGCIAGGMVSFFSFGAERFFRDIDRLHWREDEPGYWWHVLSTGAEWVMINAFAITFWCLWRRMYRFDAWHRVKF